MSYRFSPSTISENARPPMATWIDLLDVGDVDPVAGAGPAVDLDLQVGLADDVEDADVLDPGDARGGCSRPAGPVSSRSSRSVPMSLTELAPLMPERASSMLSRMSCEKLKLSPSKSRELLGQLLLDLVPGHPLAPLLHRAGGAR